MPQVATFHLGDEVFGVDILTTKEMGKVQEVTPVPGSPKFILGLMNLRGQIVTLMDPGVFLDQKSIAKLEDRRLIILKNKAELEELRRSNLIDVEGVSNDTIAILIDHIGDVLDVAEAEILPAPPNLAGNKKQFVSGVIHTDKNLIILLNISSLIKLCIDEAVTDSLISFT